MANAVLVNPIPKKPAHDTTAAKSALTTLYGITTTLPDPVIHEVGRDATNAAGLLSPQTQSDLFLALLRERHIK